MTGKFSFIQWTAPVFVALACVGLVRADDQSAAAEKTPAAAEPAASKPADAGDAARAKAAFQEKFEAYKAAVREIEKLQTEYQSATPERQKKLNEEVTGHVANAQTLVNAMIGAAQDAYRAAPNTDKEVTDVLVAVAKHYAIGQQLGPGIPSPGNPEDTYIPIDGGDQYEKALPIIKLLIDGGTQNSDLYVWGFLSAYVTNDFDLAEKYLAKAKETGALDALKINAGRADGHDNQSGLAKNVARLVTTSMENLEEYKQFWAKESELRAAEAKANDLPQVKLTTTKGVIVLELFENQAPESVANFLTLVKQGFYTGSPFHRVLPEFMAQGGAKTDDGQGGPGYTIKCECYRPDYRKHFRGTLSMAHAGKDTGNSQFFLTFVPTAHLNGRHTAFGRVIEGMEVLGDLQHRSPQHEVGGGLKPDRILKAEVVRDRGHEYKFEKLGER